ncbi:unnamed protein product [Citrullus colocynthis]|uniref:Uncharacterized protein n=1 Tax=Citrullus colocynthis TaxID=252529 RepID=A0ABP0Z8Z0_9ROSI
MAAASSTGLKGKISSLPPKRGRIKAQIFESLVNSAALAAFMAQELLCRLIRDLVTGARTDAVSPPSPPPPPPPPPLISHGGSLVTDRPMCLLRSAAAHREQILPSSK